MTRRNRYSIVKQKPRTKKRLNGKKISGRLRPLARCSKEKLEWIHPSLSPLLPRRRLLPFRSLPLSIRIRNRLLNYRPIPRVMPYFCKKCLCAARHFNVIKYHVCMKSKRQPTYYIEKERRIALNCVRRCSVRSSDALAVLERVPFPQHISVFYKVKFIDSDTYSPPSPPRMTSLSELCLNKLNERLVVEPVPQSSCTPADETMSACMCNVCGLEFDGSKSFIHHLTLEPSCVQGNATAVAL